MIALNALLRAEHNRVIRFHHENSPHKTRMMTPRPGSVLSDADLNNEGDWALSWDITDMIHSTNQAGLTKIWQNHKKSSAHNASNVTDYLLPAKHIRIVMCIVLFSCSYI